MSCPPTESDSNPEIIKCPNCGALMNVGELRPYTRVSCPDCHETTHVHDCLGAYRIVGRIAQGGMSEIFEARDTVLGRVVALKILNETYSAQHERVLRFEKEAQIMARVAHDNIVKIYTVGRAYGAVFIAMELVDGHDMETTIKLQERPIPEEEALRLIIQAVDGLQAAWDAGVLHRDIKPANILLDSNNNAKIVDFGLSLLQSQEDTEEELWVTPYYASPEALMRQPEDLRSDMYALGVTLYQILAGRPPFEEIPKSTTALIELKRKLPTLREIAPEISTQTAQIVETMMEFSPDDRFENYVELRQALTESLNQLRRGIRNGTVSRAQKRSTLLRKARRRKLLLIVGAILASLVVVVAGVLMFIDQPKPTTQPIPEEEPAPQQAEPENTVMTREQVGKLYSRAEEQLKRNEPEAAKSLYMTLAKEQSCPLTTRVWARLHVFLLSEVLGNEAHAKVERSEILSEIQKEDPAQVSSSVVEIARLVNRLNPDMPGGSFNDVKLNPQSSLATLELVGYGMNMWMQEHPSDALQFFSLLDERAKREPQARMWRGVIAKYQIAARKLVNLQKLPDNTKESFNRKLGVLDKLRKEPSPTPGSHYTNILRSIQLELQRRASEMEAEFKRQEEEKRQNEGDLQAKARNELLYELEDDEDDDAEEDVGAGSSEKDCGDVLSELARDWNFAKAVRSWEYIRDNDSESWLLARTLYTMGRLGERFMQKTEEELPQLLQSNKLVMVKLKNGKSCKLLAIKKNKVKVKPFDGSEVVVPLTQLTPEMMFRIHSDVLRADSCNASEKLNRQFNAIAFLYLVGEKEMARAEAAKLFKNTSPKAKRLERQWSAWMSVLNK